MDSAKLEKIAYGTIGNRSQDGAPTIAEIEHAIAIDMSISAEAKQRAMMALAMSTGGMSKNSPLSQFALSSLLGGGLGAIIAKYFSMGPIGMVAATAGGYGLGKVVNDWMTPNPAITFY